MMRFDKNKLWFAAWFAIIRETRSRLSDYTAIPRLFERRSAE